MAVARNILKNPKLLPGGGATELTVSASLKQKSSSIEGVEKVMHRITILHKTGAVELKKVLETNVHKCNTKYVKHHVQLMRYGLCVAI